MNIYVQTIQLLPTPDFPSDLPLPTNPVPDFQGGVIPGEVRAPATSIPLIQSAKAKTATDPVMGSPAAEPKMEAPAAQSLPAAQASWDDLIKASEFVK